MEISTARIALQENRLNDLYQETMLMVFDSVSACFHSRVN